MYTTRRCIDVSDDGHVIIVEQKKHVRKTAFVFFQMFFIICQDLTTGSSFDWKGVTSLLDLSENGGDVWDMTLVPRDRTESHTLGVRGSQEDRLFIVKFETLTL